LFTYKLVPVIFEPPCIRDLVTCDIPPAKISKIYFGTTNTCYLWTIVTMVTLQLLSVTEIHFIRYGKPFLAKFLAATRRTILNF
jgi:hypothetical protein